MNDIQSLLFYITCFILASLMVYVGDKKGLRLLTVFGLMVPIFIGGLRYYVGTDYATYIYNISLLENIPVLIYFSDFSSYLEPTFYVFTQVAHLFNFPHLVFFIYSSISIIFLYKALKTSGVNHRALVYLLLLLIMFPMSFNLVRQFAAISIATYATTLLFNGNKKKYYIFTILASLVHVSALVNIVVSIVYKRVKNENERSTQNHRLILGITKISIVSALIWYGLQKYSYLFEIENVTTNLNLIPRLFMLLFVLTFWYSHRPTYRRYRMFIDLGILCIILGVTGFFIPYGDRIALYFLPFIIILFPASIYNLMPKNKKHLALLAIVLVGVLYFTASYYIMGSHAIIPYKTILETPA